MDPDSSNDGLSVDSPRGDGLALALQTRKPVDLGLQGFGKNLALVDCQFSGNPLPAWKLGYCSTYWSMTLVDATPSGYYSEDKQIPVAI